MIKKSMLSVYNTPNQNIKTVSDLMFNLLDSYNGDWTTEEKKRKLISEMRHSDLVAVAEKVFGKHNQRHLAVEYTPKSTKCDTAPTQYVAFNASIGKWINKPKYVCAAPYTTGPISHLDALSREYTKEEQVIDAATDEN